MWARNNSITHINLSILTFCSRGRTGRTESNYDSMLQEDMNSRLTYQQERSSGVDHTSQIQKNWSPTKNFSNGSEDLPITSFKSINQDFPLVDTVISPTSAGFPVGSVSFGYPSTLVQSLFDSDSQSHEQSLFNNNRSIMSYSSTANNYGTNSNELSPSSWPKFSAPFYPKQQPGGLHFSNKTPFWNASTAALTDTTIIRPGLHPSSQSQYLVPTFEGKPKCSNLTTKVRK